MVLCGEQTMLADTKIRASKPAEKPYKLGDAHLSYLMITTANEKLWRSTTHSAENSAHCLLAFTPWLVWPS
jgi:hypothetical protein